MSNKFQYFAKIKIRMYNIIKMNILETIDNSVQSILSVFDNQKLASMATMGLILYSSVFASHMPTFFGSIVNNFIFKFLAFYLIVKLAQKNPGMAIITTIAVLVTIMSVEIYREKMTDLINDKKPFTASGCSCKCDKENNNCECECKTVMDVKLPDVNMKSQVDAHIEFTNGFSTKDYAEYNGKIKDDVLLGEEEKIMAETKEDKNKIQSEEVQITVTSKSAEFSNKDVEDFTIDNLELLNCAGRNSKDEFVSAHDPSMSHIQTL